MAWQDASVPGRYGKKGTAYDPVKDTEAFAKEVLNVIREMVPKVSLAHQMIFSHHQLNNKAHVESKAIGGGQIQAITPMEPAPSSEAVVGRTRITVDRMLSMQHKLDQLQEKQNDFDFRKKVGRLHSLHFAQYIDNAALIAATKAGMATATAYNGLSAEQNAMGGTQLSIGAADRARNPSAVWEGLTTLMATMAENQKAIVNRHSGHFIVVRPLMWDTLAKAQQVYNREYKTSDGTSREVESFTISGVPVVSSANLPAGQNITTHLLNSTTNSNFFNGDFRKVVALITHPDSLMNAFNFEPTPMVEAPKAGQNWWSYQTIAAFTFGVDDVSQSAVLTID